MTKFGGRSKFLVESIRSVPNSDVYINMFSFNISIFSLAIEHFYLLDFIFIINSISPFRTEVIMTLHRFLYLLSVICYNCLENIVMLHPILFSTFWIKSCSLRFVLLLDPRLGRPTLSFYLTYTRTEKGSVYVSWVFVQKFTR